MSGEDLYKNITQNDWNVKFCHPFTFSLFGPTGCGKSQSLLHFLKNVGEIMKPPPTRMVVAYKHRLPIYDEFKKYIDTVILDSPGVPSVEFIQGMKNVDLLVIDDLLDEVEKVTPWYTYGSHHTPISIIFLSQNMYAKNQRDISLNSHHMSIFKNPRDSSQISTLANQLEGANDSKLVKKAFKLATKDPHSYLLINCRQKCHEYYKYRNNIIPEQSTMYVSTSNLKTSASYK